MSSKHRARHELVVALLGRQTVRREHGHTVSMESVDGAPAKWRLRAGLIRYFLSLPERAAFAVFDSSRGVVLAHKHARMHAHARRIGLAVGT